MSKEAWFAQFERLEAERDAGEIEATDDELSDMAHDAMVDPRDREPDEEDLWRARGYTWEGMDQ